MGIQTCSLCKNYQKSVLDFERATMELIREAPRAKAEKKPPKIAKIAAAKTAAAQLPQKSSKTDCLSSPHLQIEHTSQFLSIMNEPMLNCKFYSNNNSMAEDFNLAVDQASQRSSYQ